MVIQSQPQAPKFVAAKAPQQNNQQPEQPEDGFKKGGDDTSNVWKAIRAVPSSVAGALVCGVGATLSSAYNVPKVTIEATKALVKTPKIGTNLKVMTAVLMPFAAVAAVALSPVAGALYGLCTGFVRGAEDGIGEAVNKGAQDIKKYHTEVAGSAVKWLKDEQTANLPEGETPYDIPIAGAAKGLVGGAVNGVIGGAAATVLAAGYAVPGAIRAEAELWKSDIPLPFKIVGTPLVPVGVALAAGLAPAAGVIYGLGAGAATSYQKGLVESVSKTGETIKEANSGLYKAVFQ
ncbi:MAG: hypothetical protein J0I12_05990 [Candidatus Eremiobacteraeota bacterium]|nr:hypothetical protein [Candidatus Eremiobacteraeota bacterium]